MNERPKRNTSRYSISVSGKTYDRMRSAVPRGGVAAWVDDILMTALEDSAIAARLIAKCLEETTP